MLLSWAVPLTLEGGLLAAAIEVGPLPGPCTDAACQLECPR